MINSFDNYMRLGKIKRKTPDIEESRALKEKSMERLKYVMDRKIDEKIAKFVLEDSYDAIREAAQSLMSASGFKPYSHEATISFIVKYFSEAFTEEDIIKFDQFRIMRNNSVYNASEITKSQAESCLRFAIDFIDKVKKISGT